MNSLNVGSIGRAFAQMLQISERAAGEPPDDIIQDTERKFAIDAVFSARMAIGPLWLPESNAALDRFEDLLGIPGLQNKELHVGLRTLARLMQSELEKLQAFALDREKQKYFRDETWETSAQSPLPIELARPAPPLFSAKAQHAFPSTLMDIGEAGRCLALGRNNAAVYHLMQIAEIGLRILARDRRVVVQPHNRAAVPLEFAQWGQIITELNKEKEKVHQWLRSKALREEAHQYYATAIFEVSSFNDIFRKHISHARGKRYEDDTAVSCWGHVYRFMDKLAERMSENEKTPLVWKVKK